MKDKSLFKKILSLLAIVLFVVLSFVFIPKIKINNPDNKRETIVIDKDEVEDQVIKDWEKYYKNETDLSSIREKYDNNDIIAELYIPDVFDVYIAKTSNNEYYLDHSLYRKKDIKGAEYMDYRVDIDSEQINIYGHNSSTFNIPFRQLEKFLKQEFFEEHPYIILTYDGGEKAYEILSIKEVSKDYEHMKVKPDNMVEHIDKLKNDSIFVRNLKYDENTRLLVLQTCSYAHEDNYYVITAIEIDKK